MAKVNGVIPKQVTYVTSKFTKQPIPLWDGEKLVEDVTVVSDTVEVLDSKSKSLPNMIERHTETIYGSKCFFPLTSVFSVDNDPIKVRILENNRYDDKTVIGVVHVNDVLLKVAMTKDCLVEVVKSVGVSPGGNLNGEYVWMRSGGNTRLTRVDSKEYNLFASETSIRDGLGSPINKKELIPGAFYRTATATVLYCGSTETDEFHVELRPKGNKNGWNVVYDTVCIEDVTYKKKVMQHSWVDADEKEFERYKAHSMRYIHVAESNTRRVFKKVSDEIVDLDALFKSMREGCNDDLQYAIIQKNANIQAYEGNFNNYAITRLVNGVRGNMTIRKAGTDVEFPDIITQLKEVFNKK